MSVHVLTSRFNHLVCCAVPVRILPAVFNSGTASQSAQSYDQAWAFVGALTQQDPATAIIDIRCIHDQRKDVAAIPRRGRLPDLWNEICAWNTAGFGVFITINEMDGNGREITNVQTIRCQAIDLDNLSAQQNYERATQFNPPPSFAVQSSPGRWHVYWQTPQHKAHDRFTLLQRKLASQFDSDKKIIDPSRVLRLPGTFHQKQPGNPHLVTCWALAGYNKPIDPGFLEIALHAVNVVIDGAGGRHDLGHPKLAAPSWERCQIALNDTDPNELDRAQWISFTSAWKQSAWNFQEEHVLFDTWSQWCARYTKNDPAENLKNWNSLTKTEIGWPWLERRNDHLRAMRLLHDKPNPISSDGAPPMPISPQQQIAENAFAVLVLAGTHADTATAFAMKHNGKFLYNASRKQWLQWDGKRWLELQPEAMLGKIRQFCISTSSPDAKRPRTLNFWQSVVTTLTTMPEFLREQKIFDADNYVLNTPNGTINLRTGDNATSPHNPADHITNITSASPTPISETWEKFINQITGNDNDTAKTLQIMLGASLSGAIEEHWIGFLWGNGRNGKSALIEAIAYALGDYAKQVPSEVFASNKHEQHPTGLTTLMGGRFTFANEVKEGTYFDTSVLKTVSGDETIEARYMQGNFFSFKRTFKLFLIGNDLPQIRTQDVAIKTRLRIVPFRANFAGKEDRDLPMILRANAGAVLQWLLEGHQAWIAAGKRLAASGAVEHATAAYFAAQSTPEMWLSERARIITQDNRMTGTIPTAATIYDDYASWKRARGEQGISQTKFGTWLAMQPGIEKVSSNGVRYRGIELTAYQAQPMPGTTATPPMPGQVVPFQQPSRQ
jgi:P4 family phage/plasmid primase-like protien